MFHNFLTFLTEEEISLPSEVFSGFKVEKNTKASSSRRTVLVVRSDDRDKDRDEIDRSLKQAGLTTKIDSSNLSGFDPIFTEYEGQNYIVVFKPAKGGMSETTLNASITELFPCIAFEMGITPTNPKKFYDYIVNDVDASRLKSVAKSDKAAAADTIDKAEGSSKFEDKMNNAIGVTKFIYDTNKDKRIQSVMWGYRAKQKGVPKNHPGDIFLKFRDGSILGVSLKAGGKKTSEPKLNTYVNPIFLAFGLKNAIKNLRQRLHGAVFSKIPNMPPAISYDEKDRRKTENILKDFNNTNNKEYEELYNQMLEIIRTTLIDLFNRDKQKTLEYIRRDILRNAPEVPTMVIKAVGSKYEEVTDDDELGVFLPVVKVIKCYKSDTAKQDWFIDLQSRDTTVTMKMTVRTNKSGHAGKKKLGQFFNLSVKYNGLVKK